MIDVLLATFNGARYLPDLLESLDCQTYRDWRLVVRDDGSTDGTIGVIDAWAERHQEKVKMLQGGTKGRGPCANFSILLETSEAPCFMFCDQDDVWLPDKMTLLLNALRRAETQRGRHTPILAHSDLIVVDEKRRPVSASFWPR